MGGEIPEVELFLPDVGGTVHDWRHWCVPASTPTTNLTSWDSTAGEEEEESQEVDVGGGQLPHVVNTGQADGER